MSENRHNTAHGLPHRYRQQGFSLVEAMIGFLILSTGLLGIASLQAISLQAGQTSAYSSVATMKAEELFESMRANSSALTDYAGAAQNNACTGANICTQAELAADDLFWWRQHLSVGMPASVDAVVNVTAPVTPSALGTASVTISWQERNKAADGSVDRSYTATTSVCTAIPC